MNQMTLWTWVRSIFQQPTRVTRRKPAPGRRKGPTPPRRRPALRKARPEPEGQKTTAPARAQGKSLPPQSEPARAKYASKQGLYDDMVRVLCARHDIRVKKWRTSMSGVAWEARYRDGSVTRFLESPQPKSPMSAAIFLHEVGHHVIGLGVHKPRCLEEYHAWMYSLAQMEWWGVEVTDRVRTRVHRSLRYAARKAQRRGIRQMPPELAEYL